MRWTGAAVALFFFLAVCLLVVAIRVETRRLREKIQALHEKALHLETERDAIAQDILALTRREALEASYLRKVRVRRD